MAATAATTNRITHTITGRTHTGHGIGMAGIGIEGWIIIGMTIAIAVLIIVWPKPPDDPSPPSGPGQGVNVMRILIAAAVWLFGCAGALAQVQGPIYCGSGATATLVAAGTTALTSVPAGASERTFICGYTIYPGATASAMTIQLEYGTSATTPCDTGPTPITGILTTTPSVLLTNTQPNFYGLLVPAGKQVCVVAAGTTVAAIVQFFYVVQ
jgi:hypothetical protein